MASEGTGKEAFSFSAYKFTFFLWKDLPRMKTLMLTVFRKNIVRKIHLYLQVSFESFSQLWWVGSDGKLRHAPWVRTLSWWDGSIPRMQNAWNNGLYLPAVYRDSQVPGNNPFAGFHCLKHCSSSLLSLFELLYVGLNSARVLLSQVVQGLVIGKLTSHCTEMTLLKLSVFIFAGVGLGMVRLSVKSSMMLFSNAVAQGPWDLAASSAPWNATTGFAGWSLGENQLPWASV